MEEFIYAEMMVHVGLCTSKEPNNVLIISDKPKLFENELNKHDGVVGNIVSSSIDSISKLEDDFYDVVVNELDIDGVIASQINRILRSDGQLVTTHPSLQNIEENKVLMKVLGQYFKIIMPFNVANSSTSLLCSKEYHPTADINLHRADMLDNVNYYNCDVHIGSFAMGNYIRKEYLGVIKN